MTFRQAVRAVLSLSIVFAWLAGFLIVVWEVRDNPDFLDNLEGVLALLAVTGTVVVTVVREVFTDNGSS